MPGGNDSWRSRVADTSFEVIAESIPHIVWLADATGSTDYFNGRGTDYTGMPRQANYGWQWVEMVHPDDAERARLGWAHATATETPFELVFRIRRCDDQFRWHRCRALPVRGPKSEVIRWVGTADDIHDHPDVLDDNIAVMRQTAQLQAMLAAVQPSDVDRFGDVPADELHARVASLLAPDRDVPMRARGLRAAADHLARLGAASEREVTVLRLIATGYTNAEIANRLGLSLRSVEASRAALRRRFGVRTRAQLVRIALELDLVETH